MMIIFAGILTASVIIVVTAFLSKHFPVKLIAASTLCAIAFIYVNFSLHGRAANSTMIEVVAAIAFYLIAVIGFVKNNCLIVYGIILHSAWDNINHYNTNSGSKLLTTLLSGS